MLQAYTAKAIIQSSRRAWHACDAAVRQKFFDYLLTTGIRGNMNIAKNSQMTKCW